MSIDICFIGENPLLQKSAVRLLGSCFDAYWEKLGAELGVFPYREISFIALADGKFSGHCGILPFDVSDGNGGKFRFAGIASVAVAPEFRNRGIAGCLCDFAANWAEKNDFDALPLFTSVGRVYSSVNWKNYPTGVRSCTLETRRHGSKKLKKSVELDENERAAIVGIYEKSSDFAGKVFRTCGSEFNGWPRILGEPEVRFACSSRGYAVFFEGVLAEINSIDGDYAGVLADIELPESFAAALAPGSAAVNALAQDGFKVINNVPDVWHGEYVMMRECGKAIPENIAFPLLDKF